MLMPERCYQMPSDPFQPGCSSSCAGAVCGPLPSDKSGGESASFGSGSTAMSSSSPSFRYGRPSMADTVSVSSRPERANVRRTSWPLRVHHRNGDPRISATGGVPRNRRGSAIPRPPPPERRRSSYSGASGDLGSRGQLERCETPRTQRAVIGLGSGDESLTEPPDPCHSRPVEQHRPKR